MIFTTLSLILAQTATPRVEDMQVEITARLDVTELEVGGKYSFVVNFDLTEQLSASDSGVPAPILQLDVPASAKLSGKYVETYEQLSRNASLSEPYERLLKKNESRIEFELIAEPQAGETIGLIVLAYLSQQEGGDRRFLRRRLELPLLTGANARSGERTNSHWGVDEKQLQIGDSAAAFDLPRADDTRFALRQVLGKQNVLVTTCRAHW